ncbi:AraC family transcriptional regulator [Streptomyces sp. VRA16 Mangrove soil]|uniref:helix-turn-helix domain-containing protein n=1 Tax=Streptomyces sp. VRA16 Mangrove soil TaxID=2817434 RepID=UPI001A9E7FD1|nr:AraC family transcriptional regulator [Streptomyces sp. VRA16 Mangrove soil]MBO1330285.1 helix-turn-helix transcriptional regulator [Streptomyces sp. VRA16 Mangrove soil]
MTPTHRPPGRPAGEILSDHFRESSALAVGVRCREVSAIPASVPRDFLTSPHSTGFQLMLFAHGDCPAHMVDFADHRLQAGEVLWIGPRQVHRFGPPERYHALYVVARPGFLSPRVAARVGLDDHTLPSLLRPGAMDRGRIDAAVQHLRTEIDLSPGLSPADADEALRPLFTVLLLHLSRVARTQRDTGLDAADPVLAAFRSAVEEHYRHSRSAVEYARMLGHSRRTLDRAVRAATGRTAKQYVDDRVALEAKRLLVHTDLPAWRIGHRLGFTDPANFTKFFQAHVGTTPAGFRHDPHTTSPDRTQRP